MMILYFSDEMFGGHDTLRLFTMSSVDTLMKIPIWNCCTNGEERLAMIQTTIILISRLIQMARCHTLP